MKNDGWVASRLLGLVFLLLSLPAQSGSLEDLTISPVDSAGNYTVSWSAAYATTDYVLQENSANGITVVQRGGSSYSSAQALGESVSYRLARMAAVLTADSMLIPIHRDRSVLSSLVVLPSVNPTLPVYDPAGSSALTWIAESSATDYAVEVQLDNGDWAQVQYGSTLSYGLPVGLATGRYQYRVSSCNASGCSSPSLPQGFIYQDETDPAVRGSHVVSYARLYYDAPANTQLQQEIVHGARTDVVDDTTTQYDTAGNITSIINALTHTTSMSGYNARGQVGAITDANGVTTELDYHVRGWLTHTTVKDPNGNTSNDAATVFDYDNVGQLTQITLPDGSLLIYEYDDAKRLEAIENTLGERIEYTLDNAGNREAEVICAAGTGGSTGNTCTVEKEQTRVFDALSRLRKDIGSANVVPVSKTTRYDYDKNDNLNTITDGQLEPTNQTYDALNRLEQQIDPDADNGNLADNPRVVYSYDSQDRIKTVTDQEGLITTYDYNVWGDMTQVNSPDTGITDYRYDNAGNRTRKADANGQVVIYHYDALNRLTAVIPVGSSEALVTYKYDDTSTENGQINYGKGRLTAIVDESGRTNYRYDHRGNTRQKTTTVNGITYTTGYSYTLADRLQGVTYPSGRLVTYVRDSEGRMTAVTTQAPDESSSSAVVSNISYKAFGPVNGYDYANGISRALTYDKDYLLTDIEDTGSSSPLDWFYIYDANRNIEQIQNQLTPSKDQGFSYDRLNRLETATVST